MRMKTIGAVLFQLLFVGLLFDSFCWIEGTVTNDDNETSSTTSVANLGTLQQSSHRNLDEDQELYEMVFVVTVMITDFAPCSKAWDPIVEVSCGNGSASADVVTIHPVNDDESYGIGQCVPKLGSSSSTTLTCSSPDEYDNVLSFNAAFACKANDVSDIEPMATLLPVDVTCDSSTDVFSSFATASRSMSLQIACQYGELELLYSVYDVNCVGDSDPNEWIGTCSQYGTCDTYLFGMPFCEEEMTLSPLTLSVTDFSLVDGMEMICIKDISPDVVQANDAVTNYPFASLGQTSYETYISFPVPDGCSVHSLGVVEFHCGEDGVLLSLQTLDGISMLDYCESLDFNTNAQRCDIDTILPDGFITVIATCQGQTLNDLSFHTNLVPESLVCSQPNLYDLIIYSITTFQICPPGFNSEILFGGYGSPYASDCSPVTANDNGCLEVGPGGTADNPCDADEVITWDTCATYAFLCGLFGEDCTNGNAVEVMIPPIRNNVRSEFVNPGCIVF